MNISIEGRAGPLLYAIAIISFGLQQVLYVSAAVVPAPGPPWSSTRSLLGLLMGTILIGGGLATMGRGQAGFAISFLAPAIFLRSLVVYVPGIVLNIRDPRNWTSGFELLSMCGAALSLLSLHKRAGLGEDIALAKMSGLGRILFAGPLVCFVAYHF